MKVDALYTIFKNHTLLQGLSLDDTKELFSIARFFRATKGQILYSHDARIEKLFLLAQGRIMIANCVEDNIEVVSEIIKEGDFFGEVTLQKSPNTYGEFSKVLSGEAIIFSFELSDFENKIKQNAALAHVYAKIISNKWRIINNRYCDLVFKDTRQRVLNFFILHAQHEGKWTGNRAEIKMFFNHQDIANFTASSRQTVTTIINSLIKENKLIYIGRSSVIIPDMQRLFSN